LIQAESVFASLKQANPALEFSVTRIITKGDRQKDIPLNQMPGRGAFVKEVEEALLDDRIDLAVHSLKDLPIQIPPRLSLTAVTMRLDPRDVLVSRGKKLVELAPGSIIGTGSLRRTLQLSAYRPDLRVQGIRGNIDTRLHKVFSSEVDGVIVAAAAMLRLGWEKKVTEYLPIETFLPEVGQGTLAIEIRSDDEEIAELVRPLNHEPTWQAIVAERAFIHTLGGGCRTPITAMGIALGDTLILKGMATSVSENKILWATVEGSTMAPEALGIQLAQRMWEMGAS
jgi:hydroxymethylbilane synthase